MEEKPITTEIIIKNKFYRSIEKLSLNGFFKLDNWLQRYFLMFNTMPNILGADSYEYEKAYRKLEMAVLNKSEDVPDCYAIKSTINHGHILIFYDCIFFLNPDDNQLICLTKSYDFPPFFTNFIEK